jgi:hypothetical protein
MDGLNLTTWDDYRVKLHMPFTWYRSNNTTTSGQWSNGCYWCNNAATTGYGRYFRLETATAGGNRYYRAWGMSMRAFSNTYVEPDNTWTVVAWTLWSAGIFYNTTLWLISITNGSDKSFTIKDKNEWATTVYSDWDVLTEENMGKVFQWGNNYGFPSTWAISKTSSTQVNTSSYAPSTYNSDTYITGSYDWSDPENNNLWGETTWIVHVQDGKVISATDTSTLAGLEDTTITSPTNWQVLSYNSTSQKRENTTFQWWAIQYNTNSPYKPGYFRVGTQAQYDALQQYYTEQPNDTIYFCI